MPTNFIQETGFLITPFNLMTTELNALGSATNVISSVGGTSGVFTQSSFGSGIWAAINFKAGGAFTERVAGGCKGKMFSASWQHGYQSFCA